jgi:hypothetical protein
MIDEAFPMIDDAFPKDRNARASHSDVKPCGAR